jgi:hypothetical protein
VKARWVFDATATTNTTTTTTTTTTTSTELENDLEGQLPTPELFDTPLKLTFS